MRVLLALFLALSLAFGSVAEALARTQMAGASGQAICGDATGLISLDASGNPVAPHPCTHCLAASVIAVLSTAPGLTAPATLHPADPAPMPPSQTGITPLAIPHARGPPSAVV